jgi:hypothetical protein
MAYKQDVTVSWKNPDHAFREKKENTAFVPLTISEVAKKTLKRPTNSEVLLQRFQRAHFKTCFFSTFLW